MTVLAGRELDAVAERLQVAGIDVRGPLQADLIAGGRSNLTFRLDDGASVWVLRMPPRAGRTPSAHDVAREFRVTSALAGTGVPVPPALLLCEDDSVLGAPFAVSGFVPGFTIQSRADLGRLSDAALAHCVSILVGVLATLHRVDHVAIGLDRFGRPHGYAERQVQRWTDQWALVGSGPATGRLADELSNGLRAALPEQRATAVVHGDFRIDNTILDLSRDEPRVAAVVDWELSTIGDPVADVAMMSIYRHPALDLILGEPSAWTSSRLPDGDALAAAYESAGGVPLSNWDFHQALAHFKLAVIAAGIDHRHRAGATNGPGFDTAGQAVEPLLEAGLVAL